MAIRSISDANSKSHAEPFFKLYNILKVCVAARSYIVYLTIIFYSEVSQYFTDLANIRLLVKDAISVLFVLTIVGERRVFLTFN